MKINKFTPNIRKFELIENKDDVKKNDKNNGFSSLLKEKLDKVNDKQITAEKTTEKFVKGEDVELHEVMLSTQEAKMSLELAVQIRNKLIDAYKEIDRMQI